MTASSKTVGYECEFMYPPPKVLQTECSICLLILREPHLTSCCGHNFCRACIERVQNDEKPCPLCKEAKFTIFHNKGLERNLKELVIYCEHKEAGCSWRGEFGRYDDHLAWACPHVEMKCQHANCHGVAKRKDISLHEASCGFRPFHCDWCQHYDSWYDDVINNHWPLCPKYPVPCEQCEVKVERQRLPQHVEDDCPLKMVDCEFSSAGCKERLLRKDLQVHLNTELLVHLAMVNKKLANENVILSKRLSDLEVKMADQKSELDKMAVEKVRIETKMVAEIAKLETKMADQKGELNKQFKMVWISISKKHIGSVSSASSAIQTFSYAAHVPPEAKEVLIYVSGYTGHNAQSQSVEITLETSEDGVKYTKCFYLYLYPQNAVSYNSENMFFPVTRDRCIHVKYPEGKPATNYQLDLFAIGYRL
eukprot:Em0006g641a